MTVDLAELRPASIEAAEARALELLAEGQADEAVALLQRIVERAVSKHGDESVLTGMAQSKLAEMLHRTGAPEAEQLGCLTDAIKAFSASVGPTDPQTTTAFARLAHVALAAQAVEIAVTAGMQALAGLRVPRRGRDRRRRAASMPRWRWPPRRATRPPRPGAAERAYRSRPPPAATTPTVAARSGHGARSASRVASPVTDELSLVAFGVPPAVVIELDHVAPDGALDQHNHGLRLDAVRALLERTADGAVRLAGVRRRVRGRQPLGRRRRRAVRYRGRGRARRRRACGRCARRSPTPRPVRGGEPEPGRNDPCPCGSGRKYKRCCGL